MNLSSEHQYLHLHFDKLQVFRKVYIQIIISTREEEGRWFTVSVFSGGVSPLIHDDKNV